MEHGQRTRSARLYERAERAAMAYIRTSRTDSSGQEGPQSQLRGHLQACHARAHSRTENIEPALQSTFDEIRVGVMRRNRDLILELVG